MIGMNFRALLILFVAALIAAGVLHYVIRYRFLEGFRWFRGEVYRGLGRSLARVTGAGSLV